MMPDMGTPPVDEKHPPLGIRDGFWHDGRGYKIPCEKRDPLPRDKQRAD